MLRLYQRRKGCSVDALHFRALASGKNLILFCVQQCYYPSPTQDTTDFSVGLTAS